MNWEAQGRLYVGGSIPTQPNGRLLKDSDGRTAREESMEKVSSTFKKMHGLQKSYNILMRGRMGKFRSPVWKTSLALFTEPLCTRLDCSHGH